jgi:type IV pilus assembly protein PilZ
VTQDRRQQRINISLKVQYRTAGAFLVSYSVNLSKGGIFLETSSPLEIGERIALAFEVPGAGQMQAEGVVAWVRKDSPDGLPDGMGVQFDHLDEQYGDRIDGMVRTFMGLTVLVVAASHDRLALLGRYVRSIIACDIVEGKDSTIAEVALEEGPDLVIVDLDLRPEIGMKVIETAKSPAAAAAGRNPPVILLAGDPAARTKGKQAGADEALATPPSFHDLQAAVVRMLSRPSVVAKHEEKG